MLALCTLRPAPTEQALAARAREAGDPSRVADRDRVRGDVSRDDRACADHRARADANGSDEDGRCADRRAVADVRAIPIGRA